MINLFDLVPNEIMLEIFKFVSRQTQAKLARVDKRFNQLANHKSQDLFKYKSENKKIEIENVCLWILKNNPVTQPPEPYKLHTTKDGIKVDNSGMWVSKKFFDACVKSLEKGYPTMIELMKNSGWSASFNAKILEEALNRKNEKQKLITDIKV